MSGPRRRWELAETTMQYSCPLSLKNFGASGTSVYGVLGVLPHSLSGAVRVSEQLPRAVSTCQSFLCNHSRKVIAPALKGRDAIVFVYVRSCVDSETGQSLSTRRQKLQKVRFLFSILPMPKHSHASRWLRGTYSRWGMIKGDGIPQLYIPASDCARLAGWIASYSI